MKIASDKVTVSLALMLGILSSACAKQDAPQPQPEETRAGAATETQPAAPSPVASAAQPTDTAPSAAPAAAPASAPTSSSKPVTRPPPAPAPTEAAAKPAAPTKYTGDSPCVATSFKFAAVRSACEHGGRPEGKGLMKNMTKKAGAAGTELKCNSCHTSLKTYELKDNAVADLRKWL